MRSFYFPVDAMPSPDEITAVGDDLMHQAFPERPTKRSLSTCFFNDWTGCYEVSTTNARAVFDRPHVSRREALRRGDWLYREKVAGRGTAYSD